MKRVAIASLLLAVCLSVSCNESSKMNSFAVAGQKTYRFTDARIRDVLFHFQTGEDRFTGISFKVRNDRRFEYIVLKNIVSSRDLLRQLESETHCEIIEAGHSVLIILPKIETSWSSSPPLTRRD